MRSFEHGAVGAVDDTCGVESGGKFGVIARGDRGFKERE